MIIKENIVFIIKIRNNEVFETKLIKLTKSVEIRVISRKLINLLKSVENNMFYYKIN